MVDWKRKKKALHGLVGGIAVVAAVAGFVGGMMSPGVTITVTAAIVIVGVTLVNVLAA